MHWKSLAIAAVVVAGSGCYHAVVDTSLAPSPQVIDVQWAHGFVYGLVPPSVVETASKCPHGVSKVETQHSFLNMLAQALTFGLYTPMEITVTCAATGAMADASTPLTGSDVRDLIARAAVQSEKDGQSVAIRLTAP